MKTIVKIFLISIFTFALTCSCQKEVDNVKFPEFKSKLVISGFLSPDETDHYISVLGNQIIYGNPYVPYDPGTITGTISNGINEISLRSIFKKFTNSQDSAFLGFVFTSSELLVEEGITYTLKVMSDKGLSVESSCTVPLKKNLFPTLDTVRITGTNSYDNSQYSYLQSNFYFTDIKGEENYYSILSEITRYNSNSSYSNFANTNLVDPKYGCFSDKDIEGERLKVPLGIIYPKLYANDDSAFLKIYLLNTDKPYYDYHRSILNYNSGETPFTEPSPIYSNINQGLGVFAAYTYDSIIVRLK